MRAPRCNGNVVFVVAALHFQLVVHILPLRE